MVSVKSLISSNVNTETATIGLTKILNKSVDLYNFSKQQLIRFNQYLTANYSPKVYDYLSGVTWLKSQTYMPFLNTLSETLNNPTAQKIKHVVEKYTIVISALPGIRDILITILLKKTGFTAAGVKSGTLAALIQSKFYGAYIAKGSIFSYLQSIGVTCWFDPTLLTLLLLGGTVFYYFYVYKNCQNIQSVFKWEVKDIVKCPQITVPNKRVTRMVNSILSGQKQHLKSQNVGRKQCDIDCLQFIILELKIKDKIITKNIIFVKF